jgi:hypothetical protein
MNDPKTIDFIFGAILTGLFALCVALLSKGTIDALALGTAGIFSAVVLPAYVGLYRGAAHVPNRPIERVRGWVMSIVAGFVTLALAVMALTGVVWPEFVIALAGVPVAWYVGRALINAFPLALTHEARLTVVGGAAVSFLSPIVVLGAANVVYAFVALSFNPDLDAGYVALVWPILTYALFIVVAERTAEALLSAQSQLEEFDNGSGLALFIRKLWKNILVSPTEFGARAIRFTKRHSVIPILFIVSLVIFSTLGWSFPNASKVGWGVIWATAISADLTLGAAFEMYRRLAPGELLLL